MPLKSGAKERFFFYMSKLLMKKIAVCAQTLSNCACFWPQKARCMKGSFCFCCLSSRLSSVFPSLPSITSELAKAQFFTFPKIFYQEAFRLFGYVVGDGWQTVGQSEVVGFCPVFHFCLCLLLGQGFHAGYHKVVHLLCFYCALARQWCIVVVPYLSE